MNLYDLGKNTNMKSRFGVLLVILCAMACFFEPSRVWAAGACTCARFNGDPGCNQTPNPAGSPGSGPNNAGSNQSSCPVCKTNGMPQWWVSEPYINLHVSDLPLTYTTSSGQEMAFRFYYHQR